MYISLIFLTKKVILINNQTYIKYFVRSLDNRNINIFL